MRRRVGVAYIRTHHIDTVCIVSIAAQFAGSTGGRNIDDCIIPRTNAGRRAISLRNLLHLSDEFMSDDHGTLHGQLSAVYMYICTADAAGGEPKPRHSGRRGGQRVCAEFKGFVYADKNGGLSFSTF